MIGHNEQLERSLRLIPEVVLVRAGVPNPRYGTGENEPIASLLVSLRGRPESVELHDGPILIEHVVHEIGAILLRACPSFHLIVEELVRFLDSARVMPIYEKLSADLTKAIMCDKDIV